jgi:tetratricopeptide (TPR) repeat protein
LTPSRTSRRRIPRRKLRGVAGLLALSLLTVPVLAAHAGDSSLDARIRYYRARLGGRSTYPAYARLGLAYAEKARVTGRTPYFLDAARSLERSLAMQRNYEALLGLAGVSLALHRFPESLGYAREALETSPGDPAARGAVFDAELGLGHVDEAAKVLDGMPADSFAHLVRRAALHEYRGEIAAALRDAERACALPQTEPRQEATRAWCEVRLGALHLASCEPETARTHYGRASASVLGREHLAELDAAEGKPRDATARYRDLVAAVPEPRYRLQLAALYDAAGKSRDAADQRERARAELLRRAAEDVRDAWHELAVLQAERPETAADALRWAEKDWRNRQDVHAADALAWASLQHGDAERAATIADLALAPGGRSPTLLLHAAIIRLRTGRAAEARALFERALACPAALTPLERRLADGVRGDLRSPPGSTSK